MSDCRLSVINLYQCDPGFSTGERFFDYDYILYVHEGKGVYKINGISYQAAMGDIFYCPPEIGDIILADQESPFLLSGIEFLAPAFRELLPRKTSLLSHRFLIEAVREMVREYRFAKTGHQEICNSLLQTLLLNLSRMNADSPQHRDPSDDILEYLAENFHRNITHEEISRVFRYHKNTINRMLIRKTGLTLKDYLISLRMRHAAELLKYSSKTIAEISEFCGYSSPIFFSRQFREKMNMTPSQFRMKYILTK